MSLIRSLARSSACITRHARREYHGRYATYLPILNPWTPSNHLSLPDPPGVLCSFLAPVSGDCAVDIIVFLIVRITSV